MNVERLTDKKIIEDFCKQNVFLHIYCIGDLDDFFWPNTSWFALVEGNSIRALTLIYSGCSIPVLLALSDEILPMKQLIKSIKNELPDSFYAHLSPGLEKTMESDYEIQSHGTFYKMGLEDKKTVEEIDGSMTLPLIQSDKNELINLYEKAYPDNWFDIRMLETGQYFGIKDNDRLISVAGVHVFSNQYQVAALGNIATDPQYRGKGYAKAATAKLCQSLLKSVDDIGLNVKSDNHAAIGCYKRLGFKTIASYGEFTLNKR